MPWLDPSGIALVGLAVWVTAGIGLVVVLAKRR
jgi:hypothetical protein